MASSLFGNGPRQIPIQQVNPIPQQSQQMNPQIQSMIQMFKNGGSPQSMMQSMISMKNPQMAQAMQLVNAMGGDPKNAFFKLAAQKGVDPNSILNMLR